MCFVHFSYRHPRMSCTRRGVKTEHLVRAAQTHFFYLVLAHIAVVHHLPTSHRWLKNESSIRVCVFQKSSYRHMFRRNMLCVLDPFPPFLSTPPLTQPSLQTGICYTGADPRGGELFGLMAEQSPSTKDTREWL